jgi:hypothetical protein
VSGDAILYRLCTENKITPLEYQQYRNFKDQQRKQEQAREKELRQTPIPRLQFMQCVDFQIIQISASFR